MYLIDPKLGGNKVYDDRGYHIDGRIQLVYKLIVNFVSFS